MDTCNLKPCVRVCTRPPCLAVNNYGYLVQSVRALHSLCKAQQEVSSSVIASVVCADQLREGRSIEPDWHVFLVKEQAQESCYSVAGELRRDLQLLREKLHISLMLFK